MWNIGGDRIRIVLDIKNTYTTIKDKIYDLDRDEIILITDLGRFDSEYCTNLEYLYDTQKVCMRLNE